MRHLVRWMMLVLVCVAMTGQVFANCDNMTVVSPNNGATVSTNQSNTVTIEWSAQVAAANYDIYFGPIGSGCLTLHGTVTAPTTEWSPPAGEITPGTTYTWRVVALGPGLTGCLPPPPQSLCATFTVASCPVAPTINSPADNSTVPFGNVTLDWNNVPGATSYELFAGADGDPLSSLDSVVLSQKTVNIEPGRTIKWKVVANAASCTGAASPEFSFTTTCPTAAPSPLSPANGAAFGAGQNINFSWSFLAGAAGYDVKVSDDAGATWDVIAENLNTNFYTTDELPQGDYMWEVRANFNGNCDPLYSDPREFSVGPDCTGNDAPGLIAPAAAETLSTPITFKWTARANAESYRVFVRHASDNLPRLVGTTTQAELTTSDLEAGVNEWHVVARFADCPDVSSSKSSFTLNVEECANAEITLISPTERAATSSPVHVSWSPVADALFYRVWISVDGDAPVNILRLNATEATIQLPAGEIEWYVDAPRGNCDTVVSGEGHFTVQRATNCPGNTAPVLVSPVGTRESPAAANDPSTLIWNAVPNAIGYRIWISENLTSFEDIALTQQTQVQLDLDPGTYAWYSEALFGGCDALPSATAYFRIAETTPRCPTGKPTITSPLGGQVKTSPVTFAWTAVADATKYRVFVSIDGSDVQLIGVTDETELTRELPPGIVIWRVEAVFERCPSTFSDRVTFTVAQSQNCNSATGTQLVAPANNATNVTSPVDFVWSPVSGAVKYVLVVQVNDGAPTAIAVTSDTNVTREMPSGIIRWHVVTFFSGCEPVESDELRFTIARTQACDNRKPILLLPSDDSRALPSPVDFQWTAVPNATNYLLWARQGDGDPSIIATTTEPSAQVELAQGRYEYFVEAHFEGCPPTHSGRGEFVVTAPIPCGKPLQPQAQVVGQALSNTKYRLRWTPLPNVQFYEVQESTSLDFSNATTLTTDLPVMGFVHEVNGAPVQYLYRVRGVSDCGDGDRGSYSDVVGVFIVAPRTNNASAEIGAEDTIVQKVFVPGSTTPLQFTATSDKPWLTITPATGTLPVEGITLTVTANAKVLALGTNTGTIQITYSGASGKGPQTNAGTTLKIPLSISLVTPVEPSGKGTPPPDSLIFPVVGHATGANDSLFESDIRVTNLTAETARYELNFTPSNTDGTQTGSSSTIEIAPNATLALDDIVASLFGTGTTTSATGMLEVRPLTTSSSASVGFFGSTGTASTIRDLATAASSRTYNFTPKGTFGQYIPAIRFSDFVGKATDGAPPSILSLQQVAQSSAFRANFGFAEASGAAADLVVRVYDTANTLLATIPVSLKAGEHQQLNGMLATNGINNLIDGRVEVEVVNGAGKVTAYVSEVDNKTNDPLLVSSVLKGAISANKYVVPGVAYLNNPGAFWVTDLRVFNAGPTATPATVTFYPERNPSAAITREITLEPGEIEVLDNVLVGLFGQSSNIGGAIAVTTPTNTQLTATARTYNQTTNGSYGQYIPGVTPAQSVGVDDRALQILQLEQSSRIRTNIGLNETAGQAVTLEVSVIVPDLLVTPVVTIPLQPNEFQQISLGSFGLGDALYNARVTVKVIGGTGRVTAYGSAIDQITQDPTYVPAQ